MTKQGTPSLLQAMIPVLFLIGFLAFNVLVFKDDATGGPNQIALMLSAVVAAVAGTGTTWKQIEKGMVKSISLAMPAMLILLLIGALAGTWLISGIVPAMIYYGLKVVQPEIFLFAACIVSAIVALATGSSWTTIATVGIALLGIGKTLGLSEGLIGGAIISGAYFGDKMSPLSDTTNLAPAMAGSELFTHIRYMVYTTVPSISIALLLFLIIGFSSDAFLQVETIESILASIDAQFYISGWLFLVPAIVIVLIIKKVPAFPALLSGVLLGAIAAVIFQYSLLESMAEGEMNFISIFSILLQSIFGEIVLSTENEILTNLLSSSGMQGMLGTIWLIISAMMFGGAMETTGFLQVITRRIISVAKSTGSLIASTAGTCIFFNLTASDQYLSIVVPGRMFKSVYKERGLKPENLSRTLEDSGTVTSVLIPWNTCGAVQAEVLNVATLSYFPFCFFNIISPFMTVIFGIFRFKIARYATDISGSKPEDDH